MQLNQVLSRSINQDKQERVTPFPGVTNHLSFQDFQSKMRRVLEKPGMLVTLHFKKKKRLFAKVVINTQVPWPCDLNTF